MKAFGLALLFAVLLAIVSSFVLEGLMARRADQAFSTASARVGEENTVVHRNFMGRPKE
ncbi:hypothetical protein [Azospirillum sp. sgz302134]